MAHNLPFAQTINLDGSSGLDYGVPAQIRLFQLETGNTGSEATSVLAFVEAQTREYNASGFFSVLYDEMAGTRVGIFVAGRYLVSLGTTIPAEGTLQLGIGRNLASDYAADPGMDPDDPDILAALGPHTTLTAAPMGFELVAILNILPADLMAGVEVMGLASDGAAGAPGVGDIAPNTWLTVDYLGPVSIP